MHLINWPLGVYSYHIFETLKISNSASVRLCFQNFWMTYHIERARDVSVMLRFHNQSTGFNQHPAIKNLAHCSCAQISIALRRNMSEHRYSATTNFCAEVTYFILHASVAVIGEAVS